MPIIRTYYKVHRVFPDPDYFYMENTSGSTATFTVSKNGTPASTDLSYSLDKVTWTDIHTGGSISNVADGAKVYFRSSTGFGADNNSFYKLNSNRSFDVGGSIHTLINYLNVSSVTSIPSNAFRRCLYECNVVHANIDFYGITTVANDGCYQMFARSGSLVTIPDMSSIQTVETGGFNNAFGDCVSLQTPADLSNVTSLANYSLSEMYNGCTLLADAVAPNISTWNNNYTYNWLANVASVGVVRKPAGLTITTDSIHGVPTGWTTENY